MRIVPLFALAVLLAACGGSTPTEAPAADAPAAELAASTDVALTVAPVLAGDTLTIAGTATVSDGAYVSWSVEDSADNLADVEGNAQVTAGAFSVDVPAADFASGELTVWVAFQPIIGLDPAQPAIVAENYGEMGEKMTGSQVTDLGGGMRGAELETTVVKP